MCKNVHSHDYMSVHNFARAYAILCTDLHILTN